MAIIYVGSSIFTDVENPAPSKNDWGIDIIHRRMRGPSTVLADYIATLSQGQTYGGFYLQTWEPEDRPPYAYVVLIYKGLRSGIPAPASFNSIVQQTGSTSADFSSQNGGLGYQYGVESISGAIVPLYALSAVREFAYYAPQTVWRYIYNGTPSGAVYGSMGFSASPSVIRSRITTDDGHSFGGNAPTGLVSALAASPFISIIAHASSPIYGTPYRECEDVVQYGYPSS